MALKTFVKVSNVNNLSDARYCAGMYVNWMGFNLEDHSPNYVSPQKFKEITGWLSGPEYVGEFDNAHPDTILQTVTEYDIHIIQIREEAHLQMLLNTDFKLVLKQVIRDNDDVLHLIAIAPSLHENGVVLLLESDLPHLGPEMVDSLRHLAGQTDVLLGFGFSAATVEEVVKQTQAKGIALNGGDEIKPGLKDFDDLADILEVLELEE